MKVSLCVKNMAATVLLMLGPQIPYILDVVLDSKDLLFLCSTVLLLEFMFASLFYVADNFNLHFSLKKKEKKEKK